MKNAVFWDIRTAALVRTDVSEERVASIIRMTQIGELETPLVLTRYIVFLRSVLRLLLAAKVPRKPILLTLMMVAIRSSETSVLTTPKRRNNPEDCVHFNIGFT
jgi:hypothetical protein